MDTFNAKEFIADYLERKKEEKRFLKSEEKKDKRHRSLIWLQMILIFVMIASLGASYWVAIKTAEMADATVKMVQSQTKTTFFVEIATSPNEQDLANDATFLVDKNNIKNFTLPIYYKLSNLGVPIKIKALNIEDNCGDTWIMYSNITNTIKVGLVESYTNPPSFLSYPTNIKTTLNQGEEISFSTSLNLSLSETYPLPCDLDVVTYTTNAPPVTNHIILTDKKF